MVATSNEWILERTGIRERHLVDKGVAASDLAVGAARDLAARHNVDLSTVEVIIVGTVTPDMMYPSTACLVQKKLEIPQAWGFDLSAGCSGFVYSLTAGAKLVESGSHKKVLVIGSDVDCFISHQANMRIITATADRLKMPREKVIINIEEYGNTTAGTIPLAMMTAVESGRLKKGVTLLIASVGAGFTAGASVLKWAF